MTPLLCQQDTRKLRHLLLLLKCGQYTYSKTGTACFQVMGEKESFLDGDQQVNQWWFFVFAFVFNELGLAAESGFQYRHVVIT